MHPGGPDRGDPSRSRAGLLPFDGIAHAVAARGAKLEIRLFFTTRCNDRRDLRPQDGSAARPIPEPALPTMPSALLAFSAPPGSSMRRHRASLGRFRALTPAGTALSCPAVPRKIQITRKPDSGQRTAAPLASPTVRAGTQNTTSTSATRSASDAGRIATGCHPLLEPYSLHRVGESQHEH